MTKGLLKGIPIVAAIIVIVFGLWPPGIGIAIMIRDTNPVVFYSVLITAASAFGAWVYKEVSGK